MMVELENDDIRWLQRFNNFCQALNRLAEAIKLKEERELSSLEQQGFIKAFEFTHELAWNVIKDYSIYQGETQLIGSRDAVRYAFKNGLITNGEAWMDMIKNRNKAVHTYDEDIANDVVENTYHTFYSLFCDFKTKMQQLQR